MSLDLKWNTDDKNLLRVCHDVANCSPAWLLPPSAPAYDFPLDVLPGGETPFRGARLLVVASDLTCAVEVELRSPYPDGAPAGGLAISSAILKDTWRQGARPWPPAPDYLFDGPFGPGERLEIAGTDLADAEDALSHASDDPARDGMCGVQLARGVGAGSTDGHRSAIPTSFARGSGSFDGSLFLPRSLVSVLRVFEARDATVDRWTDETGAIRCLAEGWRWRAAWVTPARSDVPIQMMPRILADATFAQATIATETERGARTALRKAIALLAKWQRKHVAGTCAVQVRLGPARVEFWGATHEPEWVERTADNGTKASELQVYEDVLLGALGHPDPLPAWSPLGPVPWAAVAPQYLLDALDLATPLREVRLLGASQAAAVLSPVVFYGERVTCAVMPVNPGKLDELEREHQQEIAA